MREIIIIRKKRFNCGLVCAPIVIDDRLVAEVENGQTVRIKVDENEHKIYTMKGDRAGNVLVVKPGTRKIVLHLNIKLIGQMFYLTLDKNDQKFDSDVFDNAQTSNLPRNTPSNVCGLTVAMLLFVVSISFYSSSETNITGFILGTVFSLVSGTAIIMGGFWFYVIPNRHRSDWKFGCVKPNQSYMRKTVLAILSIISPILVFIVLFLNKG